MRKYFLIPSFLLISLPSGVVAWLSLVDRFSGEGKDLIAILNSAWYQALFPIVGLAVLLFGIWWTRDKKEGTDHTSSQSIDTDGLEPSHILETELAHDPMLETLLSSETILNTPSDSCEEGSDRVPRPTPDGRTKAYPPTLLDASATALVSIFEGRTTLQARPVIDAQIGNLIRITGQVFDIVDGRNGGRLVSVFESSGKVGKTLVNAYFEEDWTEAIQSLSVDQEVIILGYIEDISMLAVTLVSCSLVRAWRSNL